MEAAIGYQKLARHPKIPPPIRARPNRGNDFQLSTLTTLPGNQFRFHVDKPPRKAGCATNSSFQFFFNTTLRGVLSRVATEESAAEEKLNQR